MGNMIFNQRILEGDEQKNKYDFDNYEKVSLYSISVADTFHFDADPDPRIRFVETWIRILVTVGSYPPIWFELR